MDGLKLADVLMKNEECEICKERYIHIDFNNKENKIKFICQCGNEKIVKGD